MKMKAALNAVLVALLVSHAWARLFHVMVVMRHGVRRHLSKGEDPTKAPEEDASLLFPDGAVMMEEFGKFVRKTYLTPENDDSQIFGASASYDTPEDFAIQSSNLLRTLGSAQAFVKGLYDNQAGIPVTVAASDENDFLIRPYTKCPVFSDRLQQFLNSDEFSQKEEETRAFRQKWAKGFDLDDSLELTFDVYDKYVLAKDYSADSSKIERPRNGINIEDVTDEDMQQMYELVSWLEARKFGPDIAGKELAARLLGEIVKDVEDAVGEVEGTPRLSVYSAHYPTMMALVTSMTGKTLDRLPRFGEAIIVEMHNDGLRMGLFEQAGQKTRFLSVDEEKCPNVEEKCSYSLIKDKLAANSVASDQEACALCQNTSAPVCGSTCVPTEKECPSVDDCTCPPTNVESASTSAGAKFGFVILGFACALVVAALVVAVRWYLRRTKAARQEASDVMSHDGIVPSLRSAEDLEKP